jgi:hypothetical protein
MEKTMNYEKLTVERFAARLKENAYKGLTGARRAIGKTDWTKKDKERGHELANEFFGDAPKAAAKATTKKASAAPKAAAKKKASAAPAKKAAAAKPAKKMAASKAPPPPATPTRRAAALPDPDYVVPASPPILEEVTRQNSASAVIAALRSSGPLNELEQRAYDVATAEYAENASKAARRIIATAARGIPTPGPLAPAGDDEAVQVAPGAVARIPVTNGTAPNLTPEEQQQFERLQKGQAAVPALLGQADPTGTPSS